MKNLLSKHLFNRPYSELPLASEIYVDHVIKKTMWSALTVALMVVAMVCIAKTFT